MFHEDSLSCFLVSILTIQITTIPAIISVKPDGNALAAMANAGLYVQPPAGQLVGVFSAMNPIIVKIAPMIVKANPSVWNECFQEDPGVIRPWPALALSVNGLNSSIGGGCSSESQDHGGEA
jgi:hypothetical protein